MDSRIQADRSPEVSLRVVDGFGKTLKSDALQDSKVTIQAEATAAKTLRLSSFSDSSSTFCTDYLIKAGVRYTLLIQAPGFSDLNSFTEVPDNVVAYTDTSGDKGPNGGLLPKGDRYLLPLVFDDPISEDNYYHVIVTVRDIDSDEDEVISETLAFNILPRPSDAKPFEETSWIFGDKDFAGSRFRSNIVILKESIIKYPKPVVTIELRTVSVDYFNYYIQNSRPKSSDLPPHGQSGSIDNVAGGVGLFGGYSSYESSYQLEF